MAAAALLVVGVVVTLLCCLGAMAMRSVFDRLHFVGPAALFGGSAIAAAVALDSSFSQSGLKAILIVIVMIWISPITAHVTARAERIRRFGSLDLQPGEEMEG